MKHRRQRLVRAGVVASLAALGIAAPASAASPASPARTQLNNSKSPAAASTPTTGAVPNVTDMNFEVDLKLADPAGAAAFARAVSTPGTASYGKYLTAAQWEARFAPSAASVKQVKTFLTSNGFTVNSVSADNLAVEASGTASQVEQAFGTSLSYHSVDKRSLLLANTDLSVPSSVAGAIGGVTGVSDTVATPASTTGATTGSAAASTDAQQPPGFRNAQPCGAYYGQKIATSFPALPGGYPASPPYSPCGYTPPQLRGAYNVPPADTGVGKTVAIVDAYASPTIFSDAHTYATNNDPTNPLHQSQLSQITANTFNKGKLCGGQNGWWGEETLDVEAVHATAPGANILFAGAKNCLTHSLNKMLRTIVDNHLADVITNSYGDSGGDVLDSANERQATDDILEMAAATGITVTFSSGDDGDEYTTVGSVAADYPATSPWATAVGGTTLQIGAANQRTGENGWSTAISTFCNQDEVTATGCKKKALGTWGPLSYDYGSGGGTSIHYTQPWYQQGVVPASLSQANSSVIGPGAMRVEPDISMDADPTTGMLVGETQTFPDGVYYDQYRIGGTSLSSPLMAGLVADADEANGNAIGFLNPKLYALQGNALADILGPASPQDIIRSDFIDGIDAADGYDYSARTINYEGPETYCNATTGECSTRGSTALDATPGYDNMTGLGAPGTAFVQTLGGH
jgi:subtilase family serine protease